MEEAFPARPQRHPQTVDFDRKSFPTPPSLHWGLVLLFTILTVGIFGIIWPFIHANWVRKIDRESSAMLLIGLAVPCLVVGYVLYIVGAGSAASGGSGLLALGGLLILGYWILYLIAYFSMAGSMRRKLPAYGLPVEIGGVTLFFFTLYYLQGQLRWVYRWKNTGQVEPKASKGVFWALLAIPFVISILAAIAIPAYQDYLVRSQVSEAAVLTDGAKTAVAEYYANNGQLPSNNAVAGLAAASSITGRYVSSVQVVDGMIGASYDTANSNAAIRDKLFILRPHVSAGSVSWDCTSSTVPEKYLPSSCRN
ncbi:MAG: pilin [Devosia sp.]